MVFLLFHKADVLLRFGEGRPFLLYAIPEVLGTGSNVKSLPDKLLSHALAGVVENLKSSSRFVTSRSECHNGTSSRPQ